VNNDLERSDEEFIEAIEFKDVHDRNRKENKVRKINTLLSSTAFIKSLHQFDANAAEEKDSNANINVKVVNEEELIN
jgi:hypothetical protein